MWLFLIRHEIMTLRFLPNGSIDNWQHWVWPEGSPDDVWILPEGLNVNDLK